MKRGIAILAGVALALTGAPRNEAAEPIIGGPCEGCEIVFVEMPENPPAHARIAPPGEAGEPLRIAGTVTDPNNQPAAGVIIYAYHTDATGVYPPASTRHGRLRGWARTDENGRYSFDTIRPGAYPGRTDPQHIHLHVIEPGFATYWIDSIVFSDDPLLTDDKRHATTRARGGSGIVIPVRDPHGVWIVRRDIDLGRGVPGYER